MTIITIKIFPAKLCDVSCASFGIDIFKDLLKVTPYSLAIKSVKAL